MLNLYFTVFWYHSSGQKQITWSSHTTIGTGSLWWSLGSGHPQHCWSLQMSIRFGQVHHVVQVHRCSTFRSMRLAHSDSFPSRDWPIGPLLSLSQAISLVGSSARFVLVIYSNQKVGLIGKLSWFVQFGWICFSSVVGIYLRWVGDHTQSCVGNAGVDEGCVLGKRRTGILLDPQNGLLTKTILQNYVEPYSIWTITPKKKKNK